MRMASRALLQRRGAVTRGAGDMALSATYLSSRGENNRNIGVIALSGRSGEGEIISIAAK